MLTWVWGFSLWCNSGLWFFWDVTWCCCVSSLRCFQEACCHHSKKLKVCWSRTLGPWRRRWHNPFRRELLIKRYSITSQESRMLLYANVIALDLVCGTGALHWFIEFTALNWVVQACLGRNYWVLFECEVKFVHKDCGLHLHVQLYSGIAGHCHTGVLHLKLHWI